MNHDTSVLTTTEIHWVVSHSANCFHAADAVRRGCRPANSALCNAIEKPTHDLCQVMKALGLDEPAFWSHLVCLSATVENNTQLVEQVLRKMHGADPRATGMVARLAGRVADVEAAVRRTTLDLVDQLATRAEPFAARWQEIGPALLHGIARRTDPQFMVPKADIVLLPVVHGGYGAADLPYNMVRIEAVESDPVPQLPEPVRLAWLIAQLNIDLPMFSETIFRDRLPLVASVAILPATLEAAAELQLTDNDPSTVRSALEAWHITGPANVDLSDVASRWWESHLDMQPAWNVSLAALDQMIHDSVV